MLHDRQSVRDLARHYFTNGFTGDRRVMPRAIEAIERFGWDEAFFTCSFLADLPQTDQTLGWALDELANIGENPTEPEMDRAMVLCRLVAHADPQPLLRRENEAIEALERLPELRTAAEHRLRLLGEDPEAVWESLWGFCDENREARYATELDLPHARRLVEALAREPDRFADRVLALLDEHDDPASASFNAWTEGLAVELAGRMRLEDAVPRIIGKLHQDADLLNEDCEKALGRIGTDAAVEALAQDFSEAEWPFRLYGSAALSRIHSDLSVERSLELAASDEDESIRCFLLKAAVGQFDDRAVEPARRFLLSEEQTPDLTELRSDLLDAAELMEISFPEQERWREESKHDAAFRRWWYGQQELEPQPAPQPQPKPPQQPAPVRRAEKIGRNDPCPCGSGRKYKKCCMRA